jgi:hypothetical protein
MDQEHGSGRRNSGKQPSRPLPSEPQISPSDTIGSQASSANEYLANSGPRSSPRAPKVTSRQRRRSRTPARLGSASSSESRGRRSATRRLARQPPSQSRSNTRDALHQRLNSVSYELNAGRSSSSSTRKDESSIRAAENFEKEALIAYMEMLSRPTHSSRSDKTLPEYLGKRYIYSTSSIDAPRRYSPRHPPQPLQSNKHMAEVAAAGNRSREKHLTLLGFHGLS